MKRILVLLSFMLVMIPATMNAGKEKVKKVSVATSVTKDSARLGIEAYSDTTGGGGVNAVAIGGGTDFDATDSLDETDSFEVFEKSRQEDMAFAKELLHDFLHSGVGVTLLVIALVLAAIPLILIILLLRYLLKKSATSKCDDADRIRQDESFTGEQQQWHEGNAETQAVQSQKKRFERMSVGDEKQFRNGVRHTAIGIGLIFFFWFLGWTALIGIGFLCAFMGLGEMFVAIYLRKDRGRTDEEE